MKKIILLAGLFALVSAGLFAQEYKIGDTGPAGGIIFFDKGVSSEGWRYLEAAPVETEVIAQWGARRPDISRTENLIGTGRTNTQLFIQHMNNQRRPETDTAAQICVAMTYGGFNDWFLPSRDELSLMYVVLFKNGLGEFTNSWYWSSTQRDQLDAIAQDFNGGGQFNRNKNSTNIRVRAIRAF